MRLEEHDRPVEPGVVHVAPPDRHLIADDRIRLSRGARGARPAIDVTFRSVAMEKGPSSAAVLLSGLLNDGAHGLRAVSDCGGTVFVQVEAGLAAGRNLNVATENRSGESNSASAGTVHRVGQFVETPWLVPDHCRYELIRR